MGEQNEVITKKCTKCGEVKSLDQYHRSKNARYGRKPHCRSCAAIEGKRHYYAKHSERLAGMAQYRAQHREYFRRKGAEYRSSNGEKRREYNRQYHAKHREELNAKKREYHRRNPEVGRRAQRKRRAMIRGVPHKKLTDSEYAVLYEQRDRIFGTQTKG